MYIYYLLPGEFRNVTWVRAWHFTLQSVVDKIKARHSGMCISHIKETLTGFLQFERNRVPLFDNKSQRLERGKYLNQGTLSDQGRNHYWKVHRREVISESKSTNYTLNGNENSQLEGFGAPLLTVKMEKAICKDWRMATRSWEWPRPTANKEMGILVP